MPGKKKLDVKVSSARTPAPPFSRLEGIVFGGIAACVGVSYALAYFVPVKPTVLGQALDEAQKPLSEAAGRWSGHAAVYVAALPPAFSAEVDFDSVDLASSGWLKSTEVQKDQVGASPQSPKARPAVPKAIPVAVRPEGITIQRNATVPKPALVGSAYDLAAVQDGVRDVPRRFLDRFPVELTRTEPPALRKAEFFKIMLPLILRINESIRDDRERLLVLQSMEWMGSRLPERDIRWVRELAFYYGLKETTIEGLLERVDEVPVSLALSQAAVESAWGTSRFAQEGNAPFGQWTFNSKAGLKPLKRDAGKTHAVRRFPKLIDAVRSYAHNLNTHRAYREFRAARAVLRLRRDNLAGLDLVHGLQRYSARGEAYVRDIKRLIEINNLAAYDDARLAPSRLAQAELNNR